MVRDWIVTKIDGDIIEIKADYFYASGVNGVMFYQEVPNNNPEPNDEWGDHQPRFKQDLIGLINGVESVFKK